MGNLDRNIAGNIKCPHGNLKEETWLHGGKFCGKCVQESLGNLEFTHGRNVAGNIK